MFCLNSLELNQDVHNKDLDKNNPIHYSPSKHKDNSKRLRTKMNFHLVSSLFFVSQMLVGMLTSTI
jgi:hypothetical protein